MPMLVPTSSIVQPQVKAGVSAVVSHCISVTSGSVLTIYEGFYLELYTTMPSRYPHVVVVIIMTPANMKTPIRSMKHQPLQVRYLASGIRTMTHTRTVRKREEPDPDRHASNRFLELECTLLLLVRA